MHTKVLQATGYLQLDTKCSATIEGHILLPHSTLAGTGEDKFRIPQLEVSPLGNYSESLHRADDSHRFHQIEKLLNDSQYQTAETADIPRAR